MKIAFLVGEFPSFSETFILNQITGLIDLGHDVSIYAKRPRSISKTHSDISKYQLLAHTSYYPELPANYILRFLKWLFILVLLLLRKPSVVVRSLNWLRYKRFILSLRGLFLIAPFSVKEHKYDIIHCHFGNIGLNGLFLKEIGVIQGHLITSFHGYDLSVLPKQLGKDLYSTLFESGNKFTCGSTFMLNKAIELGCAKEKLVKLPVGVNCSDYCFRRRTLGVHESIKIITVARLVEKKGLEYSIRAVASVAQDYPDLIYRIVGDGPLREMLQKLIHTLGISHNVQLLGWKTKERVRQYYDDSHIFMLSSVTAQNGDKEGQGLVLQEAQAMGLPVLATLHNGFPDSVVDGRSAFLVPERDVEALAAKLRFLITNPECWAEMGNVGRQYVEASFNINRLNQQLCSIYEGLVECKQTSSDVGCI